MLLAEQLALRVGYLSAIGAIYSVCCPLFNNLCHILVGMTAFYYKFNFMKDIEAQIQGEEERAARNANRRERRQRLLERRQFFRRLWG